ncbi:hypothetical protein [Rhizobium sp. OAE497]|uniref:hypothetical protein n=1 Tax=Rhizobium sp. OAE497 TaxID=2663796 RepID=UPI0018F3BDF0
MLDIDLDIANMEELCLSRLRTQSKLEGERLVVVLFGPPGSGKSAIASALLREMAHKYSVYVEDYKSNEHLDSALLGEMAAPAESQRWFLEKYSSFLRRADLKKIVILDQDPLAVPLVYGRKFFDEKLMSAAEYKQHIIDALDLESQIDFLSGRRIKIYIKSEFDTLLQRCSSKEFATREWLGNIFGRFEEKFKGAHHVIVENNDVTLENLFETVSSLVEMHSSD